MKPAVLAASIALALLAAACRVGIVDARSEGANEAARKLADEKARGFKCGIDDPKR